MTPPTIVRRVCGAILRDGHILMVRHRHDGRDYWTLPGGGVEPGEAPEDAAVREAREETCIETRVLRLLYEEPHHSGTPGWTERCYLLESLSGDPTLGYDPEEAHLTPADRMLCETAWHSLEAMRLDGQVSKVLTAL